MKEGKKEERREEIPSPVTRPYGDPHPAASIEMAPSLIAPPIDVRVQPYPPLLEEGRYHSVFAQELKNLCSHPPGGPRELGSNVRP